ncbi:MAG: hypothetical protein AB1714_10905 [Acidobacteriota bacterium]
MRVSGRCSTSAGLAPGLTWATTVSSEGHLVIFDRDPKKSWDAKVFQRTGTFEGKTIRVWGM